MRTARRARAETAARFASFESDAVSSASASAAARTDTTSSFGRLDKAAESARSSSSFSTKGSGISVAVSSASNKHASSAASSAVRAFANVSATSPRRTFLARVSSHAGAARASTCLAQCAKTHAACARAARAKAPPRGLRGGADGLEAYREIISKAPDYLKADGISALLREALETENERLTEDVVVLNKELKCSNFFIRTYNKIKRLIKSK